MQTQCARSSILFVLVTALISLSPATCFANAGVPMLYLELPFMVSLLIPVVLIECGLLSKYLKLNFKEGLVLSGKANLLSTLVGFPLSWLLHFLAEMTFFVFPYMANNFDLKIISATTHQNNELLFDILLLLPMAPWLAPIEDKLHWMIPAAGAISLIPAYFVTVFFEYKFLKKRIPQDPLTVKKTIIKINLYSYLFLALIWSGHIFYNIQAVEQNKESFLFPFSLF